ncbi:MAG TPA: hypothetical protein VM253_11330 [Candidatus Limnocylindrales bacterium]|nr:hypothetical protein [Candidatus Limnocylindrales bacterium]
MLILLDDDGVVIPANVPRATLALLIVAVLAGGFVLGSAMTVFGDHGPGDTVSPSPSSTPAVSSTAAALPGADVEGEDLARLPRYPGAIRTEFAISVDERYRLTAVEYLVDATVAEVRAFYQRVIDDHGWERADVNYAAGEWTYVLVDGRTEALVEIEEWNGLVEIDLQVSEPISTPSPEPTPEPTRRPTPQPAAPPPPPPSPTGDDDDDDSDDDDWSEWSGSDD